MANKKLCAHCGTEEFKWISNCDNCGKEMPNDESQPFGWRWRLQVQATAGSYYGPIHIELCRECGIGLFANLEKASEAMNRLQLVFDDGTADAN